MNQHDSFTTLQAEGLNRKHAALLLWEKAKRLGIWNPSSFDFTQDRTDWLQLNEAEQYTLQTLTAHFLAGEEAVTLDLLPLIQAVAKRGFFEDELYLTSFLWEEAKHVDFFDRIRQEVIDAKDDLHHLHGDNYRFLFYDRLPTDMGRLQEDTSIEALVKASVTYNMIVEGVLAETGYHVWYTMLKERGIMPGIVEGIQHVQRDESRHIGYAIYLLARLISEGGAPIWMLVQQEMSTLVTPALGIINDMFDDVEGKYGQMPFGLEREAFVNFGLSQFQKRFARLEKAVNQPLEAILYPG